MKDNLPNNEHSKMFIDPLRNDGEQAGGKETLVFCTPGSTAVWVNENTRKEITNGISRNEYYDTSGPLIRIRFFGGWDFPADMTKDPDFVKKAYKSGVPMGGEIKAKPKNAKNLTFAAWALKDPDRVNLDRIQIIKSWSTNGLTVEKIYEVVWSGSRKPDPKTGKLPRVDNKVVSKNTNSNNNIGESQLSAVWADPDFDPLQPAVYYARVFEIPTPQRIEYKTKEPGTGIPEEVPDTVQERAWTSPISYSPYENS
jgi:hypothetical protein